MIQRAADGRIILGGFRRLSDGKGIGTFDDSTIDQNVHKAMVAFLNTAFGVREDQITHEWTGIMGYTKDGCPLVGKLGTRREYMACGFNGHGMAMCFKAGRDIAWLILGKEVTIPKCFDPNRFFYQKDEFIRKSSL